MDADVHRGDALKKFSFDMSLLSAVLDRWRPETHTFHLPIGEMTPTLQDVSLLLGLLCAGQPVATVDMPPTWCVELLARFVGVLRNHRAQPYREFAEHYTHGPSKKWLL